MQRPEVEILQSSAEGTRETAPKAGISVTASRSLSMASTPAETYPQKDVPRVKPVSPTNLTHASTGGGNGPTIGTASCWNALQQIQDSIVETSQAARASRLSSEYSGQSAMRAKVNDTLGVAKVASVTCWSKMSQFAWDLALPEVDSNKHSDGGTKSNKVPAGMQNVTGVTNAERLKQKAAQSVTAPELPPEGESSLPEESLTVDEDGLAVEVIENVDSL
ncbi:unnamed protein product [Cylindrotheca closterium]|uniref:Uncharacterized protein n=1 Tax=Cylindrotheca closterium TaxID=2856 RepID=A0AAD2PWZ6_9STRA|nr:unnamed protein product [Cylindrotheca closterium]